MNYFFIYLCNNLTHGFRNRYCVSFGSYLSYCSLLRLWNLMKHVPTRCRSPAGTELDCSRPRVCQSAVWVTRIAVHIRQAMKWFFLVSLVGVCTHSSWWAPGRQRYWAAVCWVCSPISGWSGWNSGFLYLLAALESAKAIIHWLLIKYSTIYSLLFFITLISN